VDDSHRGRPDPRPALPVRRGGPHHHAPLAAETLRAAFVHQGRRLQRLTRLPPVRKGGASSAGAPWPRTAFQPLREANAPIVANDPDNAPIGEDPQLESLEERISAARKAEDERVAKEHAPIVRTIGMQVISTMVGYPLGGIIIGFVLDKVFHTAPWIMLGLMFAAFAGALLHVVQMNKNNAR
jgi:F0F1-type ATP synthase assembly protein I